MCIGRFEVIDITYLHTKLKFQSNSNFSSTANFQFQMQNRSLILH